MRETVRAFIMETLKEHVINTAFSGKEVKGADMAKLIIDSSYNKMENMFEPKKESAPINQAR